MIVRNASIAGSLSDIRIENGLIAEITPACGNAGDRAQGLDAGGRTVIAGIIDPHVHLRCPGMESKEDWISGARAAIAGGVTTVIDMPNTRPATETLEALALKRAAAAEADNAGCPIGRLFWAGCSPETIGELPQLLSQPDVAGVKLFLCESSGNKSSADRVFLKRVFTAARDAGKPAAVHTELSGYINEEAGGPGLSELKSHNMRRPPAAAEKGTALVLSLAAGIGCRLYLCHLSTAAEFEMVRRHKAQYGADSVIAELTPHHLALDENHSVTGGLPSWAKVNPPLRSPSDKDAALAAALDGTVDLIGSDHAPHQAAEKVMKSRHEFFGCPSGFPGLETELGVTAGRLMTEVSDWKRLLSRLTNENPARIFGLDDRRGIAEGMRADLVLLDGPAQVNPDKFQSKAAYSPFNGMRLQISVYKTILRGKIIEQ